MQTVRTELDGNVLMAHIPTLKFLLNFGSVGANAFTLYVFYILISSHQGRSIFPSDEMAMKMLHWGRSKLRAAKRLLEHEKLIEKEPYRNASGKFVEYGLIIRTAKVTDRLPEGVSGLSQT